MNVRTLAVTLLLAVSAVPLSAKEVLPFVENDYTQAVARARKSNLPLFVDAWAPW